MWAGGIPRTPVCPSHGAHGWVPPPRVSQLQLQLNQELSVLQQDEASGKNKRGVLPKQATNVMRSWLFQHIGVSGARRVKPWRGETLRAQWARDMRRPCSWRALMSPAADPGHALQQAGLVPKEGGGLSLWASQLQGPPVLCCILCGACGAVGGSLGPSSQHPRGVHTPLLQSAGRVTHSLCTEL